MSSSPRPARIRSRLSPDERISKILEVTRTLLGERGYENLVTTEIADHCGISEATIYKYFETKRDLLTRVAEQWFAELLSTPEDDTRTNSVRDRLRHMVWESLSIVRAEPALSRFVLMELRADPNYRSSKIFELNREFTGKIVRLLEEAVRSGEFRDDVSVRLLRNMIFGCIEHQTWAYLRGEGDFDVDLAADDIADVICRGMANTSAEKPAAAKRKTASGKAAAKATPAKTPRTATPKKKPR